MSIVIRPYDYCFFIIPADESFPLIANTFALMFIKEMWTLNTNKDTTIKEVLVW